VYSEHSTEHSLFPGTGITQAERSNARRGTTSINLLILDAGESHTQPSYRTKTRIF
jgi:hypothetical protein